MIARALAIAAVPLIVGCADDACVDRGQSTSHAGTVTWTGSSSPRGAFTGGSDADVQVDDLDASPNCTESFVEFTVRVRTCLLWAQMTSFGRRTVAMIEPNQTCTLPLGSDSVTLTTDDMGTLRIGVSSKMTLSGTIDAWNGAPANGDLQWSFQGN